MNRLLLIAIIAFAGCVQPQPPEPVRREQPIKPIKHRIKVRSLRAYLAYPDFSIDTRVVFAQEALRGAGVELIVDPTRNVNAPQNVDVTDSDLPAIRDYARTVKEPTLVWVKSIVTTYRGETCSRAGQMIGGMVFLIAEHSWVTVVAHELGHLFGLDHDERGDNLMCSETCDGDNLYFAPDQYAKIEAWFDGTAKVIVPEYGYPCAASPRSFKGAAKGNDRPIACGQ